MKFIETRISGVFIVESQVFQDDRGHFTPAWVASELESRGLDTRIVQCSIASNETRGTIRGMHYQTAPYEEVKTIRVTRGAVFDVAVDIRPGSPTFKQWVGVELNERTPRMLYLPAGLAHGYQTLTDDAEVLYFVSAPYSPAHQRGVRWDDPAFAIEWPLGAPTRIHDRDRTYPDFA